MIVKNIAKSLGMDYTLIMGNMVFISKLSFDKAAFISGSSRVLDLGATFDGCFSSARYKSPEEVDSEAIQSDWQFVGQDIAFAMDKLYQEEIYGAEHPAK